MEAALCQEAAFLRFDSLCFSRHQSLRCATSTRRSRLHFRVSAKGAGRPGSCLVHSCICCVDCRFAYAATNLHIDVQFTMEFASRFRLSIPNHWDQGFKAFVRLIHDFPDKKAVLHAVWRWLDGLMLDWNDEGIIWRYHCAKSSLEVLERDQKLILADIRQFKQRVALRHAYHSISCSESDSD